MIPYSVLAAAIHITVSNTDNVLGNAKHNIPPNKNKFLINLKQCHPSVKPTKIVVDPGNYRNVCDNVNFILQN